MRKEDQTRLYSKRGETTIHIKAGRYCQAPSAEFTFEPSSVRDVLPAQLKRNSKMTLLRGNLESGQGPRESDDPPTWFLGSSKLAMAHLALSVVPIVDCMPAAQLSTATTPKGLPQRKGANQLPTSAEPASFCSIQGVQCRLPQ